MSSSRATKRTAAAAAGLGMVLASFAGAAATATASNIHRPAVVITSGAGVGVSVGAPVTASTTAQATTSLALPTTTITDPAGAIGNTRTVTLTFAGPTGFTLAGSTPVITPTGTGVTTPFGGVTLTNTTLVFTVSAPTTTPLSAATYTISGLKASGATAIGGGQITEVITSTATGAVPTNLFHVGAITYVAAPASGPAAPDTSAILFRSAFPGGTALGTTTPGAGIHDLVVATDYAPQDAESANYLAKRLGTGVVLTDPATLSTAVSGVITSYTDIFRIWIVGGTSVVSAADATSLQAAVAGRVLVNTGATTSVPQVIRYSGVTAYNTNQTIVASVAGGLTGATTAPAAAPTGLGVTTLPFLTQSTYNTSGGGISSPTTTPSTSAKTAIIVSGDIRSYQDGVASSALSYGDYLPVLLTPQGSLDSGVATALSAGGYTQAIVLGGALAVSDTVVNSLIAQGVNVLRVAGPNAGDTAALLAGLEISGTRGAGFGFILTDGTGVLLARGNGFQDALAAGAYAGGNTGSGNGFTPILLSTDAKTLGSGLAGYLHNVGVAGTYSVQPLGGALSVTPTLTAAAVAAEVSGLPTP